MDSLLNRIKQLKYRLNVEVGRISSNLQEEAILELSRELDELINEYMEINRDKRAAACSE